MTNQSDMSVLSEVWDQVLAAMKDLLRGPLPNYSELSLRIIIHDGTIRRIITSQEIQQKILYGGLDNEKKYECN
jgi:hypothetical protein